MVVQHNIMALNSHRRLGVNNTAVGKNLEKLSSGYRINRAGDDAAGLAISEKMRAQIKGLEVAQRNAQDGISLVQTAEGALDEVHSMLKRMVELSTQAANGTYDDQSRSELQKEITKLNEEIDRIAEGTNFNDIKLLDGSLDQVKVKVSKATTGGNAQTDKPPVIVPESAAKTTIEVGVGTDATKKNLTVKYQDTDGKLKVVTVSYDSKNNADKNAENMISALKGNEDLNKLFNISVGGKASEIAFESKIKGPGGSEVTSILSDDTVATALDESKFKFTDGESEYVRLDAMQTTEAGNYLKINGKTYEFVADTNAEPKQDGAIAVLAGKTAAESFKNLNEMLKTEGLTATYDANNLSIKAIKDGHGLDLQIGDTGAEFNRMTVKVGNMDSVSLGVNKVDISTPAGARAAIDSIKNAISKVSSARSDLGAVQNRLEHTISNLSVAAENMTASESRIRDVDMAREMMMFTQNNVLSQAAQAMLAQSNQQPQQILQLLR